jgi:MFS family permease
MVAMQQHYKGWLLTTLLGGIFLGNVDVAVVNIATPSIHTHLHASGAELELIVSGYALAYAVLLITSARLGDMRGYRRVFLLGLGVFTLASLACGLAPNAIILVLARILQGIGAALMVSQVLTGIQLNFEGEARARALGVYTIVLSGSAVIGQILGGVLVSANLFGTAWRPIFLINVPIGALLMVMARRFLPADQGQRSQRLDLGGVAALSIALLLLVVPLVLGQDEGWPAWIWGCLVASIPAFVLFVAMERRLTAHGGYPVINLRLLTRPPISLGLVTLGAANATYFAILFILALYLQQGLGQSPTDSGLALVPWVTAFGVAGLLVGRLSPHGRRLAGPLGALLLAISYVGIAISLLAGTTDGALLVTLLGAGGLGLGIEFTAMVGHLTNLASSDDAADMSGLLNTTFRIAGVMGVAVFGTIYLGLAPSPGSRAAIHAFIIVMLVFAVTTFLAVATAYLSIRRRATSDNAFDHVDVANRDGEPVDADEARKSS